jgi:hypothetical protein
MRHSWLILGAFALFLMAEYPLAAQYPPGGYPPGGYPPGGYPPGRYPGGTGPGLPLPGRGKKKKKSKNQDEQEQLQSVKGMLRQLDDKFVIVEAPDTRIINLKRLPGTKFLKNGDEIKTDVLKPGDHLLIEFTQDDEGYLSAVNINLEKEGSEEERAKASEPVDNVSTQASENEDERPVQRRKDSPPAPEAGADAGKAAQQPAPAPSQAPVPVQQPVAQAGTPASASQAPARAQDARPRPQIADGVDLDRIAATPKYQPIDETDSGPPHLQRGKPAPQKSSRPREAAESSPRQVAVNSPPASVGEAHPAPSPEIAPRALDAEPRPEPAVDTARPADPRIAKARAVAASFTETLPDYVCQEQMARFASTTHVVSWRPLDIVSAEVVYEKGGERYRNLAINGKPAKAKSMEELPGSRSTGEFATVLMDLLSPSTDADFRYRKQSRSGGREASVFDFEVDHEHSHWSIQAPSQSVLPAYRGSVWIDKETSRVLRIEMQAYHLPEEFPFDKVESTTEYEYTRIGEGQFLLPVHSETLMCQHGTNVCSRNAIDFRNYHKYAGEATIIFGK